MKFFEWLSKVANVAAYVATLTPNTADDKLVSEAQEVLRYLNESIGKPVWKKDIDANQVEDKW